jgi:deoxycytidine triphosphate deaminase
MEGGYLDLTLDAVLMPDSQSFRGFLGKSTRLTPIMREIEPYKENIWHLSGSSYVLRTAETINLADGIYTDLYTRRTVALNGVHLDFAPISTGFNGKLFIKAWIEDGVRFDIEKGAAFCTIRFLPVDLSFVTYQGIWHGEKAQTDGYERSK